MPPTMKAALRARGKLPDERCKRRSPDRHHDRDLAGSITQQHTRLRDIARRFHPEKIRKLSP
jgi:hypothetical protein